MATYLCFCYSISFERYETKTDTEAKQKKEKKTILKQTKRKQKNDNFYMTYFDSNMCRIYYRIYCFVLLFLVFHSQNIPAVMMTMHIDCLFVHHHHIWIRWDERKKNIPDKDFSLIFELDCRCCYWSLAF